MNKQEILNYLSEKKRITAPVAAAEEQADQAQQTYMKAKKKWRPGIIILLIFALLEIYGFNKPWGDFLSILGFLFFGGIAVFLIYRKITHHIKPAEAKLAEANSILQRARSNPEYRNGSKDFPAKFYNYYDIYRLWNFINEGRAESLKEAYNLLETHYFQEDQLAIQEDIRRLQSETAAASKVTATASVINVVNSFRNKK